MTARTHDAIAFASLITIAAIYPPESLNIPTLGAAIVGNIVGSLIPDMDQASNRLWDLLPMGDHIGKIFRKIFLSHRTLSHSLLGVFVIANILYFLLPKFLNPNYVDAQIVLAAMMIGYTSHLFADSLTKEGLPLFFPIKINIGFPPVKFLRITTGNWIENFVILPATAAYIFWFVGKNQDQIIYLIKLVSK